MLPKGNYSIEFRKKGLARHRYENVEVNITDAYPRERELNVTLYHALKEIIND